MPFSYQANGKIVELHEDPTRVAVHFDSNAPKSVRRSAVDPRPELGSFDERIEIPHEPLTVIPVAPASASIQRVDAARAALESDPSVKRVTPVFKVGSRNVVPSDRVNLGLKRTDPAAAQAVFDSIGATVVGGNAASGEYTVRLPADADPLEVVTKLSSNPDVQYVEPDFITIGSDRARRPAPADELQTHATPASSDTATASIVPPGPDPLAKQQYALGVTNADAARNMVTGLNAITVAILDEGVDLSHPDLEEALKGSHDLFPDMGAQPQPWDAHGTACAGLIGATANSIGIRGIAAGCGILAVRIAYSSGPHGKWITTDSGIRDGIDWAWQNGADVLSNSWGGGAESTAIANAFARARTNGRQGAGCIVAIAAGNDNGPVQFPATLPDVLCVSASNEYDEAKTPTSRDGETWWGSNFGTAVSVSAPGVHNYTTDISGAAGYGPGDYIPDFNGTSSATPIVAGVAALVIAARPGISEADARACILATADHVGSDPYVDGRNDRMGSGRIDAVAAVQRASAL